MQPEISYGTWYEIDGDHTQWLPGDLVSLDIATGETVDATDEHIDAIRDYLDMRPESVRYITSRVGYSVRLSMPGYMGCTDWSFCETEQEARDELAEMYGDDSEPLTIDDVTWTVEALPEETPIEGNALVSGDDATDTAAEDAIREQLESGNVWAWCTVRVTGETDDGREHSEYLGCCNYESRVDFIKNSGYCDDMRAAVLEQLNAMEGGE